MNIFQCAKRWNDIQQTAALSTINPTLIMHSSAGSKNLSSFLNSVLHFADEKESTSVTATRGTIRTNSQPATRETNSSEEHNPADHEPG